MKKKDPIDVVCLVLRSENGLYLATQRPPGKHLGLLWEFPGGKIDPGESPEEALRREIREELDLEVGDLKRLNLVEHFYGLTHIRMIPFLAECRDIPALKLVEHLDARWVDEKNFRQLDWAPADLPVWGQIVRSRAR